MAKTTKKRMAKAKLRDAEIEQMRATKKRLQTLADGHRQIRQLTRQVEAAAAVSSFELRRFARAVLVTLPAPLDSEPETVDGQ